MTKYEILHEDEKSISIKCIDEDGKGCVVTRRKQPARDIFDLEADDIIRCAKEQREEVGED